jgi:protein involved in polysaccharide export with SLBB domain
MPDRFLLALLVAATCWSLSTQGNAQGPGAPGRRSPIAAINSGPSTNVAPGVPVGYPPGAYAGSPAAGFGEATMVAADPNRKLQAGDLLLVKIEQDRDGATPAAVSGTGEVIVEPLPQPVRVGGLTVSQASNEIKRLLEKDYYYTATVRLTLEKASNPMAGSIGISGKIRRVGPQPLFADRPLKLSQAILNASGFEPYADDRRVRVTRLNKDGTATRIICDVKSVLQEGKVENDIFLQDGDQIFVPETFIK